MKVLAIGNSFSQDASRYLHQIAEADGEELRIVNLYIGGCSLETHWQNLCQDAANYSFEWNGETTGLMVSVDEALKSSDWDVITLQQVSQKSIDYASCEPYLQNLAEHIRKIVPDAALLIHETWAYAADSPRLTEELSYQKPEDMLSDLRHTYRKCAADIGAAGIIPCGEGMQRLCELKMHPVYRDGFHASLGGGRYALGLIWYGYLTGKPVPNGLFRSFDEPVSEETAQLAEQAAGDVLKKVPGWRTKP